MVATAFPHAVELLASGAGIVVDHDDPDAMALALRRVLTEPELAASMAAEAARLAPSLGWPVVAGRVPASSPTASARSDRRWCEIRRWQAPTPDFGHLLAMTDQRGTFEHALLRRAPTRARLLHRRHGPRARRRDPRTAADARPCATSPMLSLRFLSDAQDSHGRCRNRMDRDRRWEDAPALEDCWGRSIWARHGRLAQRRPPDPPSGRTQPRASHAPALPLAAGHGVRSPGCGRAAQRRPADTAGPQPALRRGRPRWTPTADGAGWPWPERAPDLRQRRPPRSDDRGRVRAWTSAPVAHGPANSWSGCSPARPDDGHLSVTPVGGSGPDDVAPASTSSRSRWRRWPMPVPAPQASTGDRRWADGIDRRCQLVPRRQRRRASSCGTRDTGGGFDGLEASTAPTSTRAPSRPWLCSRRCSTRASPA